METILSTSNYLIGAIDNHADIDYRSFICQRLIIMRIRKSKTYEIAVSHKLSMKTLNVIYELVDHIQSIKISLYHIDANDIKNTSKDDLIYSALGITNSNHYCQKLSKDKIISELFRMIGNMKKLSAVSLISLQEKFHKHKLFDIILKKKIKFLTISTTLLTCEEICKLISENFIKILSIYGKIDCKMLAKQIKFDNNSIVDFIMITESGDEARFMRDELKKVSLMKNIIKQIHVESDMVTYNEINNVKFPCDAFIWENDEKISDCLIDYDVQ